MFLDENKNKNSQEKVNYPLDFPFKAAGCVSLLYKSIALTMRYMCCVPY